MQAKECQKDAENAKDPKENLVVEHYPEFQDIRSSRLDKCKGTVDVIIPPVLELPLSFTASYAASILKFSRLAIALNMLKSVEQALQIS